MSADPLGGTWLGARTSRYFYVALSALFGLIVVVGFWPTYFGPLLAGTAEKIPFIHFHAAVYVGWIALFAAQTVLAATGRMRLHMQLGNVGIGYGVLVIVVGLAVSFTTFALRVRAGELEQAQLALLPPLVDMAVFAPFFGAAVFYRRRPGLHKRLMIVAMTALLIAAVGRMSFLGTPPNVWLLRLVWISPILVAIGYDVVARRVVHPVYVAGVAVLVAEGAWRRGARESETWGELCAWLAQLFG